MFTPDGELREEFRHMSEGAAKESSAPPEHRPPEPARQDPPAAAPPGTAEREHPGSPGFFDLVGLLAEPASIYLREARNAPPQTASMP